MYGGGAGSCGHILTASPTEKSLPLGMDAVGVSQRAADELFKAGVAVKPAAIRAQLTQPGIDVLRTGVHGDGAIDEALGLRHQLIAG